jgi:hypothetical protein
MDLNPQVLSTPNQLDQVIERSQHNQAFKDQQPSQDCRG